MPSEPALQSLYAVLQKVLGADHADTLMTRLPQHPADQNATKADMARVDTRFEQVDTRFEQIDQRFEQVDQRFEQVDQRFEQIDQRFDRLEQRIEALHTALIDQTKFYAKTTVWAMTGLTAIYSFIVLVITNIR